ncbi:MAG TPA: 30S ribosomal protein S17 [Syntrophales bacterium]|jgi:small subunit ribosomal protein S17|nr:30S ribosomal protein S17 [Syntrophales bacterium]HON22760.1 30S ribosomal protein S17 [Syntrophales bacterium]HOU78548.1 30S ribosomal protein S17 [Syntrophales bacterium]HPC32171.1 30S ribosomal protein S17 [Syntrophales bacterium]HQG33927.1 30S ribosomal protein S17 [Syntrophales bacterium]
MEVRGNRRTISGVVVSNKMDKTIVVRVERLVKHSVFHKYIRQFVKYKAHDEGNECRVGDRVVIVESRPLSKDKRWRMQSILERAK